MISSSSLIFLVFLFRDMLEWVVSGFVSILDALFKFVRESFLLTKLEYCGGLVLYDLVWLCLSFSLLLS